MASARRSVFLALGGCLTAVFEDLPQIVVNSYRVVTGCEKDDEMTCRNDFADENYTWTTADSWMFFFTLKSVFFFALKLRHFYKVEAKRLRMHELRGLIDEKTRECQANRVMHATIDEVAAGSNDIEKGKATEKQKPNDSGHSRSTWFLSAPKKDDSSEASSDSHRSDALYKRLIGENADLKNSLAELKKNRGDELDEKAYKHFIEVTMHHVPVPTQDELENLDRSLSYCGDQMHLGRRFEKIDGASKTFPTVEMFVSKNNVDTHVWGKCVGAIDAAPEVVLAWVWHLTSHERMAVHERHNGTLIRVSDMPERSRSQTFKAEFALGMGASNRRISSKYTWFGLEGGNTGGRGRYCIVWEPHVSAKDHEKGFTKNSIE